MFNNIFRIALVVLGFSIVSFANDFTLLRKVDFVTSSPNPNVKTKICEYKNLCSITWDNMEMSVVPYGSIVTALTAYPVKWEIKDEMKIQYHAADVKIAEKSYLFMAMTTYKNDKFAMQHIGLLDEVEQKFVDMDKAGFQGYLIGKNEEWCKDLEKMGVPN